MRRIFGGSIKLGPGLGSAIVAFDHWITVLGESQFPGAENMPFSVGGADFISSVAEAISGDVQGLEKDLLKKSLEETLFVAAGQDLQISPRVTQNRWLRYIKVHGQRAMIEMFLANHLWNVLWFGAGDVFGRSDKRAVDYAMRRLRRSCQMLVSAVCRAKGLKDSINQPVADDVIRALEATIAPS